jgi:hypothetical protein
LRWTTFPRRWSGIQSVETRRRCLSASGTMMGTMEYEFRRFSLPRTLSRSTVRRLLTDHAEYGGWELDRLRLFPDGTRRIILRRRIIRVTRTY